MKLFVGNLPFSVDESKLKEIFSGFETEETTVIKNKFNGRSKGFGFVVIADDEAAKKAISELNDKEFEGRQIKVSEAKPFDPDAPRPPRRDFHRGGGNFNRGPRRDFGDRGNRDRRDRN